MGFSIQHDSKTVSWYNSHEFFEVFSWLSDTELSSKYMALNRLRVWEERSHGVTKQCPIAVISTIHILYVMLQDDTWNWNLISDKFNGANLNSGENILDTFSKPNKNNDLKEYSGEELYKYISINDRILSLRQQYCLAIIRVVNLFVDQCQSKTYARSISTIASEMNIPQILVEIRHQSTHGSELPSIDVCRMGGILTLFYLFFNYWKNQHEILLNSIITANEQILIHIKKLFLVILNLSFNWCGHDNEHRKTISDIENKNDLIDEVDRFGELFHSSMSTISLRFISINIPIRNKVLNYFKELKVIGNPNEIKIANEMLDILTNLKGSKNNTFIKTKILKKLTMKLYNSLPEFYNEIWEILNIIKTTGADEKMIKCFLIDEIIERICPLCYPIAVVAVLKLINCLSNNLKVEILSFIIYGIVGDCVEIESEFKKRRNVFNECKRKRKARLFFWLRLLVPNMKKVKEDSIGSKRLKYVIDYNKKQFFEVIILLTFYKKLDKSTKEKKLLDYRKILNTICESQMALFLIFSKMIGSIPKLLLNNGTVRNDTYIFNFIMLLKELKCFEITSNLLEGLQKDKKLTYMNHLQLLSDFVNVSDKNMNNHNTRGVVIEDTGMTSLLKAGTYWDSDEFKIYNLFEKDNNISNKISNDVSITEDDEIDEFEQPDFETNSEKDYSNKCTCSEKKHETKVLNMYCSNNKTTSSYMNRCFLNAEKFNRQSIGMKEMMSERALNIDWESVVDLSE
ncbi:hypothetical protein RS030_2253 [Cryptosporidium xiaoi]|uniref:Uncharacterized protein n=1 Tax=Cryptosporidium xiaoi TaxID=659607 RepID=A0AAV9XVR7_9CRYT